MARKALRKMPLNDAAAAYLDHCRAMGLKDSTLRAYRSALDAMVYVVGPVDVSQLESKHLDQTFAKHQWKPSTRNNRLAQYKGFFAWCRATGLMHADANPAFGWKNRKVPNTQRLRIPAEEWPVLFDACRHPQETILIATGLYLFLRASEQKMIQLKHVRLDDGEIDIYRVKTEDFDSMPISEELEPYLRNHLKWLRAEYGYHPDWYLIPSRGDMERGPGNRFILGSGRINPEKPAYAPFEIVKRVLKRAGYPTFQEGEHTLRRSGARAYFQSLLDQGYDGALSEVQAMLGHELAATTERYIGTELRRHQRNTKLKGKAMFPHLKALDAQIIPIRRGL